MDYRSRRPRNEIGATQGINVTARLVVLASGNGSNLQAIIDACHNRVLHATVVGVVSDQPQAFALQRARNATIEGVVFSANPGESRSDYDGRLATVVATMNPDQVVLAGWMRLLSNSFINNCGAPIINLHPALPGELPGTRSIERAFAERTSRGRTGTGVMVHYVTDEGVDNGPLIASIDVAILTTDTLESLTLRMRAAEHQILIEALAGIVN